MRHVYKLLILLLTFIIQYSWGSYITICGVTPNLMLALIITMALSSDFLEAGIYGLTAGVLIDIFWGRAFGFYSLSFMYLPLLARAFIELIYKNSAFRSAAITFFATLVFETLLYFLSFIIWGKGNFPYALVRLILPVAFYTFVVELIIYKPVTLLSRPKPERGTRQ